MEEEVWSVECKNGESRKWMEEERSSVSQNTQTAHGTASFSNPNKNSSRPFSSATTSSHLSATIKPKIIRRHLFSLADRELSKLEAEARLVKKIEDAIHTIIIKRSRPDWLPFVPGASYWVPPLRHSYGVAEIVHQLSNPLTEEQFNSLTTFQGWPSSVFYLRHDDTSHLAEG